MLIKNIDQLFAERIKNKETRLKFVLASYNAGPGHILDAMCIAKQIGKSDTLWEGNVAEAMLLKTQRQYYTMPCVRNGYLNGAGPVNFANKIIAIYSHYKANGK
jgi:membrane-bound lytic murein transglycosylase F